MNINNLKTTYDINSSCPPCRTVVSHDCDVNTRTVEVCFRQGVIPLAISKDCTAKAIFVERETNILINDNVPCTITDSGSVLIPVDDLHRQGKFDMDIEVTITNPDGNKIIATPFPMWITVNASILNNAEISEESKGTVPELLKEAAEALAEAKDYENLDNLPAINGHELVGNKSSDDLGLQNKLTAGENITINANGEISATGGVTSYTELSDKPQINSVELSGNKTLDNLGVQAKIDNSHKLSSDLIDDTNNTNKFVTAQEKATWNEKEDASNKVTSISASSTNTEYPSAKCVYDMIVDKQKKIYFEQPKNDFRSTHDDGTPYDVGDIFFYRDVIYKINRGFANTGVVYYDRTVIGTRMGAENPPTTTPARYAWEYKAGEEYIQYNTPQAFNVFTPYKRFLCTQSIEVQTPSSYGSHEYTWVEIPLGTNLESVTNKVTSLSVSSTDTQYPSAKCVYDAISASSGTVITSVAVNNNGTITFTDSDGNTFTTTGSSVIGADGFSPVATVTQTASGATVSITDSTGTTTANISNGQDGNDYVLTAQDKTDIANIVLQLLPTTQGVLYGNTSN